MDRIKRNDKGPAVEDVQQRLVAADCLSAGAVSGVFDDATVAAVRAFCVKSGLPAAEGVDEKVWAALVDATYNLGDRTLYVQGSVDLLCEYPDGRITVADYKTDRISRAERDDPTLLAARLTDEYGSQLEQYAAAVREIYGRAPDRILIYSVPLGEALEIHLPPV